MRRLLIVTSAIGEDDCVILVHWLIESGWDVGVLPVDGGEASDETLRESIAQVESVIVVWDEVTVGNPLTATAAAIAEGQSKLYAMYIGDVVPPPPFEQDNGWRWQSWEAFDATLLFVRRVEENEAQDRNEIRPSLPPDDGPGPAEPELVPDYDDVPPTQAVRPIELDDAASKERHKVPSEQLTAQPPAAPSPAPASEVSGMGADAPSQQAGSTPLATESAHRGARPQGVGAADDSSAVMQRRARAMDALANDRNRYRYAGSESAPESAAPPAPMPNAPALEDGRKLAAASVGEGPIGGPKFAARPPAPPVGLPPEELSKRWVEGKPHGKEPLARTAPRPPQAGARPAGGAISRNRGGGLFGWLFGGGSASKEVAAPAPAAGVASARARAETAVGRSQAEATKFSADKVDCSIFAPPRIAPGRTFLIQALLHRKEDLVAAARKAAQIDRGANKLGAETLEAEIVRGASIDLFLDCPRLVIEQPTATLTWNGGPERAVFIVQLGDDTAAGAIEATAFLSIDGMAIGEIRFRLQAVSAELTVPGGASGFMGQGAAPGGLADTPQLTGHIARRYRTAFISYARSDFEQVSYFAQGLEQTGVELFVDITQAEPGEDWAAKLPKVIDEADVFYLMWSDGAARSPWVEREARHAAERAARGGTPRIMPMTLHRGAPAPPEFLSAYEFNSKWLAQREAQKVPMFTTLKST